jgi:hypothetical protein
MGNKCTFEVGDLVIIPPYTGQILRVWHTTPHCDYFKLRNPCYEILVDFKEKPNKNSYYISEPFCWDGVENKEVVYAFGDEICKLGPWM